ncbi:putative gustatory receptor 2a [Anopheles nili]|uniref:putative gustatory receptor 2a n=1 Tax=Anopheles nili TaxID=185578 RepID=UPI00237C0F43|nr:putative gustatory receptor 2a [Anopheles nili]
MRLQTALVPLYVVAKVCCLNAFTYLPLQLDVLRAKRFSDGVQRTGRMLAFSTVGVLHAIGCCLAYATYHVVSSLGQSSKLTDSNLVRVAIDLKNQYIGCILVLGLVAAFLFRQPSFDALFRTLVRVDKALPVMVQVSGQQADGSTLINNAAWLRNVLLMLVFGVGVKAVLEVSNCLMYIRDSGSPFSSNCLLLCIVPQTLCVVSEVQFVAYTMLIGDRLQLINRWLVRLQPSLACGNANTHASLRHVVRIHRELTNAIRLLDRCFGLQNVILVLYQFVTLVELGYNICMMIVRYAEAEVQQGDSTEDLLETAYWVVWFVLEIFVLCYFSHATIAEAEETAHLLAFPTSYDWSHRGAFHVVSQEQLVFVNRRTCLTGGGGLFPVDLTLLHAIIGATTTYLIILIQFDQSFNGN